MGPSPNHMLQIHKSYFVKISYTHSGLFQTTEKGGKKNDNAQKNYGFRHTPVTVAKLCRREIV